MAATMRWGRGALVVAAFAAVVAVSGLGVAANYGAPGGGGFLFPQFYQHTCPQMEAVVGAIVAKAHAEDPRMAASLLRMHFHDCFVQGCDASVLLDADGSGRVATEKRSNPNRDSLRGYEVIDEIKAALEHACPRTVSCADIVAVAARDSTVLTGGPGWEVPLGRRDSLTASLSGSNNLIPAPNDTLATIVGKFRNQGLDLVDLVALSGSHTIGNSRCVSFRQRLYSQNNDGKPDFTLNPAYAAELRGRCPRSGGDQNLFALDPVSQFRFDNQYYRNILAMSGLLNSDEVLLTQSHETMELVHRYAASNELFFQQFAKSMVKMGNISPLTGHNGEIRMNCRRVNHF
uniref:Peroxidase n=1 Tax=Oryza brachyantha TaxID=4533 RepID=J3LXV9_ORYBR